MHQIACPTCRDAPNRVFGDFVKFDEFDDEVGRIVANPLIRKIPTRQVSATLKISHLFAISLLIVSRSIIRIISRNL